MTIRKTTLQQSTSCKSISRATCVELRSTKPSKIENFDNLITALVDPTEQRFTIHQEPACAKSKVFKATCSKRRLEGREKVLRLPELKAGTFKVYCSWVYSDDIPRPVCTGSSSEDDRSAEKELLVDLYLTGAILNDLHLRNRSLHALFDSMRNQNKLLNVTQLTLVWQSTSSGSLLRKMLVDVYVASISRFDFAKEISKYPPEFVQEIAVACMQTLPNSMWDVTAGKILQYTETEEPK
jgi:hypothetical protein